MKELLVIEFEITPEVKTYMESEDVDLETALDSLGLEMSDGVDTKLAVVNEDLLDQLGEEDDDYVIVRGLDTLEFWGYSMNEVLEDLDIGLKDLQKLGVAVEDDI